MSVADLEAALLDNPDDEALFAVYADALHAAGDPRGELAAIQRERARRDTRELAAAEDALLARHGDELLGLLGDRSPHPEANRFDDADRSGIGGYQLGWASGHVRSVEICAPYGARPDPGDVLSSLLARPAARFIDRIALERYEGFASDVTHEATERQARRGKRVVSAIAAARPSALRSLSLGVSNVPFDQEGNEHRRDALTHAGWDLGSLAMLWPAVPRLRHLLLSGCWAELDALELPELRSFEMRQSFMRRETIAALGAARLPRLESLVVWLGAGDYGEVGYATRDLELLCDPVCFPALRNLGLVCAHATQAVADMVLRSAILPQLRRLDLRGGTLVDVWPFTETDAWHHLDELDLRWNPIASGTLPPPALVEPPRTWVPEVPRFNGCQE